MANGKWQMWKTDATPVKRVRRSSHICHLPSNICHDEGFTLVEMLTVIVIIVLIIGLALPVFRSLSGSRSQEGASNQIAAMLGRARAEALGVQLPRGVAFYTDANTGQTAMVLVQPEATSNLPTWATSTAYPKWTYVQMGTNPNYYYVAVQDILNTNTTNPNTDNTHTYWYPADVNVVDEVPDTNAELLPLGVGAQLINDWGLATNKTLNPTPSATAPNSDSYVSTGVIMFDSSGRLTSTPISITQQGILGTSMGMAATQSKNYPNWVNTGGPNDVAPTTTANVPLYAHSGIAPNYIPYGNLYSAFGLVTYDRDAFLAANYNTIDATYTPGVNTTAYNSGTPSEQDEERWLDQNGAPLLINRYNGTLVRAQ